MSSCAPSLEEALLTGGPLQLIDSDPYVPMTTVELRPSRMEMLTGIDMSDVCSDMLAHRIMQSEPRLRLLARH